MDHDNRASWLNRVASGMAPLFKALDAPYPPPCAARYRRRDDAAEEAGDAVAQVRVPSLRVHRQNRP